MATTIKLSCGTVVPVEVVDQLAFNLMMDEGIRATAISRHIQKLDLSGKLLGELKEVLGWEPGE